MKKIVTVTLHSALDRVIEKRGRQPAPAEKMLFPAGKGINVARTVETLGKEVVVLGLVGAADRPLFETLRSPLLHVRLTDVQGETRTNLTVFDPATKVTEHTRSKGFRVTLEDLNRFLGVLRTTVGAGDVVVLSGSLPPGAEASTYRDLIVDLNSRGAQTILDASGPEFAEGIAGKPWAVKPNMEELESLVGTPLPSETAIVRTAREVRDRGIHLVVVSRGRKGVIAVSDRDDRVWKANVLVKEEPSWTGPVGSGDALVGGMAVGLLECLPVAELVRLGVASGAANLLEVGPGVCRKEDIDRLLPQVRMSEIIMP
jgi:1-phosphofructokinase